MVIGCNLSDCIARPADETGKIFPLKEHLIAVAEGCGCSRGVYSERLKYLAGLLHDAGKSSRAWQDYINKKTRKGVPHAFAGAMLFAVLFADLLEIWQASRQEKRALCHLAVNLIHILYSHHGRIEDINVDYPPWTGNFEPSMVLRTDLPGLLILVAPCIPEVSSKLEQYIKAPESLVERISAVTSLWSKWTSQMIGYVERLLKSGNRYVIGARLCLQQENSRLITADRMHAGKIPIDGEIFLNQEQAAAALNHIAQYCTRRKNEMDGKAGQSVLDSREKWRQAAVDTFLREKEERLFSLELPTGYGKTITALSVALKAVEAECCKRIIYVAPYLSILSQAAAEIGEATGVKVLTHHHLSALHSMVERERADDLIMEAWQAPVVATSFNQLFLALFPFRAQNTLRLAGLKNAFVIVDEPQVISAGAWNIFLAVAEATTAELGTKFLFVTATMPRTDGGIFGKVTSLGRTVPVTTRYRVEYIGEENEDTLVGKVLHSYKECGSTAVILNTVRDAAEVYLRVSKQVQKEEVSFLSGRMTPLHKRERIAVIKRDVNNGEGALVVCTQVLEAGVDLSFKQLFRALPVMPSLIQAAGRCNRHGEGDMGKIFVFEFLRSGERTTRQYVYRDGDQREITDLCLAENTIFDETMAAELVGLYYKICFQRNAQQAPLKKILEAALGYFSAPAGLSPFGGHVSQHSVFVPLAFGDLPVEVEVAMKKFNCSKPADIWDRYVARGFLPSLEYTEKKQFMGLMQHFIVQVPEETARDVGELVENKSILRIKRETLYSKETGLSGIATEDEKESWFL